MDPLAAANQLRGAGEFRAVLTSFSKGQEVAPGLIDALDPVSALYYQTGLPRSDEAFLGTVSSARELTVASIVGNYHFADGGFNPAQSHLASSQNIALRFRPNIFDPLLARFMVIHARSGIVTPVDRPFPRARSGWAEADIADLFGGDPPSELTIGQIADRLAPSDTSRGTLDAQMSIVGVAQVRMVDVFLDTIAGLSSVGGNKLRAAKGLFARHRNALFTDDLGAKLDAMEDLQRVLMRYMPRGSRAGYAGPIRGLGDEALAQRVPLWEERCRGTIQLANVISLEMFDLYKLHHSDQEVPEVLSMWQGPTVAEHVGSTAADAVVEVELGAEAESVPEIDDDWLADLREEGVRIAELVTEDHDTWRQSIKQRKDRGFGPMETALRSGFGDLPPLAPDYARLLVDIMARLHGFMRQDNLERGQELLRDSLVDHHAIQMEIDWLRECITESGLQDHLRAPEPFPIEGHLNRIRGSWSAFGDLVAEQWPGDPEARALARARLRDLLFAEDNRDERISALPPPEPTGPEESATVTIPELDDVVAELLDEVILPPGFTQRELQEEMKRLGVRRTGSHRVIWDKLRDLVTVRDKYGGILYRSKDIPGHSRPPYFVVLFERRGRRYGVAESPVFGNATYVVLADQTPGTALEVLGLVWRDARAMGAEYIIHSSASPHGPRHVQKIYDQITDLGTRAPL